MSSLGWGGDHPDLDAWPVGRLGGAPRGALGPCESPPVNALLRCRPPTGPTSNTTTPSLPLLDSCKTTTPSPPPSHLRTQTFQLEAEQAREVIKDQQKANDLLYLNPP